jgi:23S rRNA (guanosine2251-2'-O)-methyltransferase
MSDRPKRSRDRRRASRPPKRPGPGGARGGQGGPEAGPAKRRRSPARGLGGDQIEGRQAVRELLLAGTHKVREVVIADDLERADIIDDISELARELKVPLKVVGRRRLEAMAATYSHQGVLARAAALQERTLEELVAMADPFLLVLDGITDPQNLGALLRTAECAGVTGVVLPRHRAVHISPAVTKAAAGAVEHLPMALVGGIPNALRQLSEAGVVTVGLDAGGQRAISDLPVAATGPIALVMGAEGRGLSQLVRHRVDTLVAIPLHGELNSLNVAAAGAIACFEVVRRRLNTPSQVSPTPSLESN